MLFTARGYLHFKRNEINAQRHNNISSYYASIETTIRSHTSSIYSTLTKCRVAKVKINKMHSDFWLLSTYISKDTWSWLLHIHTTYIHSIVLEVPASCNRTFHLTLISLKSKIYRCKKFFKNCIIVRSILSLLTKKIHISFII